MTNNNQDWQERFRAKFNIAYTHKKGWAFLSEEVIEFVSQEKEASRKNAIKRCIDGLELMELSDMPRSYEEGVGACIFQLNQLLNDKQ